MSDSEYASQKCLFSPESPQHWTTKRTEYVSPRTRWEDEEQGRSSMDNSRSYLRRRMSNSRLLEFMKLCKAKMTGTKSNLQSMSVNCAMSFRKPKYRATR